MPDPVCFMRNPYGPPHDTPVYAEVTTATEQVIYLCASHLNRYLDDVDSHGSWSVEREPRKLVLLASNDA